MPYSKSSPPEVAKGRLPTHCKDILVSAFNAALKQYGGDESRAWATAWAAVKKKCKKVDAKKWKQTRGPYKSPAMTPESCRACAVLGGLSVRDLSETVYPMGAGPSSSPHLPSTSMADPRLPASDGPLPERSPSGEAILDYIRERTCRRDH